MSSYSRTLTGLTNGQVYTIRVSAVNINGTGQPSANITATPSPNAEYINNYIRQLTGVFSKDILSDELLLLWVNEAYTELSHLYTWPWLPISPLGLNDIPKFSADFANILAYRVAPRVLELEADDSPRSAAYTKEYERMLANMYKTLLPALGAQQPSTMADLVVYVRMLMDEYSPSLSNATIENIISVCHDDIVASESWKFTSNTFPKMGWELSRVLAYAAAERLGRMLGKPEQLVAFFTQEFVNALEQVRLSFQVDYSSRANTAAALVYQARTFAGSYGKKASDSLLKTWIFEEYQNICSERPWAWLQRTEEITLAAGVKEFSLPTYPVKIHEMFIIQKDSASNVVESAPMLVVPSLLDIHMNDDRPFYTIDTQTGKIKLASANLSGSTIRVRYEVVPEAGVAMPSTIDGSTGDSFAGFAIPDRFIHILPYRVAARIAILENAPQAVYDMLVKAHEALYDAMYNDYQISYSNEPFQLGGVEINDRKYVPWFRTP